MTRLARLILKPIGRFDLSVVYDLDLREPLVSHKARIPIDISIADEGDIDAILRINSNHVRPAIEARMRAGAMCFVARIDDRIVGYNWIATGSVRDDEYRANFGPDEVYCLDACVAPDFRGKGIHTELLFAMLHHAKKNGLARAYTRVSARNSSSWKTHIRLGWREIGTTCFFWPRLFVNIPPILSGSIVYPIRIAQPLATG